MEKDVERGEREEKVGGGGSDGREGVGEYRWRRQIGEVWYSEAV